MLAPHERAAAIVAGLDVSNAALDVALRAGGAWWRGSNDEAGGAELLARVQPLEPHRIVLAAMGDGRWATGDGRRATGDGRRATGGVER